MQAQKCGASESTFHIRGLCSRIDSKNKLVRYVVNAQIRKDARYVVIVKF
jgi:hypothetical protein